MIAINEHVEINGISVRPVPLADRKTAGEGAKIQHHGKKKMVHRILPDLMRSVRWQRGSALQMKYKKKRILPWFCKNKILSFASLGYNLDKINNSCYNDYVGL